MVNLYFCGILVELMCLASHTLFEVPSSFSHRLKLMFSVGISIKSSDVIPVTNFKLNMDTGRLLCKHMPQENPHTTLNRTSFFKT